PTNIEIQDIDNQETTCIRERVAYPICDKTIHCKSAKRHYLIAHTQEFKEEVAGESDMSASSSTGNGPCMVNVYEMAQTVGPDDQMKAR
ncbi:hypothetical protein BGZ76_005389, partial [Entomortierella beljakovae]